MIAHWIPPSVAQALGWSLVHCLWQLALIALVFAMIKPHFKTSQARYSLGVAALLLCVLCPVVTFTYLNASPTAIVSQIAEQNFLGVADSNTQTEPEASTTTAVPAIPDSSKLLELEEVASGQPVSIGSSPSKLTLSGWIEARFQLLIPAWMFGIALFSLRPLAGFFTVLRLGQGGTPVDGNIKQLLIKSCRKMNVSTSVRALLSERVNVPMVIGFVRPVILLPTSMITCLTTTELEAILRHELAHIARYDAFVNLGQIVIETLLFFHPAIWWISGTVRAERENCCDDLAVEPTGMAKELASALVRLEQSRVASTALASSGGNLTSRIQRLLEPERINRRTSSRYGLMQTPLFVTIIVATVMAMCDGPFSSMESESTSQPSIANRLADDSDEPTSDDEESINDSIAQLNQIVKRLAPFNPDMESPVFRSSDYMLAAGLLLALPEEKRIEVLNSLCGEHDEQVIILCRMLFEAKKDGDFRRPYVGGGDYDDWPLEPIAIVDEVPFLVVNGYELAGEAEPAASYLQYCRESCESTKRTYKNSDNQSIKRSMRKLIESVDEEKRPRIKRLLIPQLTGQRVSPVVTKAAELGVFGRLSSDGKWRISTHMPGADALATLAMLRSHLVFEKEVARAVEVLAESKGIGTYAVSLQTIALCEADSVAYADKIKANVAELVRSHGLDGGWGYGRSPSKASKAVSDGSNTRFAVWALHVANQHGFTIEKETWQKVANYWLKSQLDDGGWGYHPKPAQATHTMSLSGICCLSMCVQSDKLDAETKAKAEKAIVRGWDRPNYAAALQQRQFQLYAANVYSLACSVTDRNLPGLDESQIHSRDWFEKKLKEKQNEVGSFGFSVLSGEIDASLAILALTE